MIKFLLTLSIIIFIKKSKINQRVGLIFIVNFKEFPFNVIPLSGAMNHTRYIPLTAKNQWILLNCMILTKELSGAHILIVIRKSLFKGPIYEYQMSHQTVRYVDVLLILLR